MQTFSDRKRPEFSVIIVNYRSKLLTRRCLDSLRADPPSDPFQKILVNNGKEDLADLATEFGCHLINNPANVGFGKAANQGSRVAKGRFLAFINPDTVLRGSVLDWAVEQFDQSPSIGIIGPQILDDAGNPQEWSCGLEMTLGEIILNNLGFCRSRKIWENEKRQRVDWVTGAALLVKRDLFDTLEGFDEDFFLYFEDIDLCRRARKTGNEIWRMPEISINHIGGKSSSCKKNQKRHYYLSQQIYLRKHFGFFQSETARVLRLLFHFFR